MNELCPHGRLTTGYCRPCAEKEYPPPCFAEPVPKITTCTGNSMQKSDCMLHDDKTCKECSMDRHESVNILNAAKRGIVDRASVRDDGDTKSMKRTVEVFNEITGNALSVRDGWLFMATVKLSRSQQGDFHADDYIDAAAYIALAGEAESTEVMRTL